MPIPKTIDDLLDDLRSELTRGHWETAQRLLDTFVREQTPRELLAAERRYAVNMPLDECVQLSAELVTRLAILHIHTIGELHQAPVRDWGGQRAKFNAKDTNQMRAVLRRAGLEWDEQGLPVQQVGN